MLQVVFVCFFILPFAVPLAASHAAACSCSLRPGSALWQAGTLVRSPPPIHTVPNFTKRLVCSPQAARRSSLSEQPEPCLRPCEYPSQRACWPPSMHCSIDYGPNVPCCSCILLLILVWHAVGKAIGDRLAPPSPRAAVDHDQTPLLGHAHQPHPVLR